VALAEAASRRGHETTLLLGPVPTAPPEGPHLTTIRFQTAADLESLLRVHWPRHEVLIMAAAVADYRPGRSKAAKLRRTGESMVLELEPVPDLVAAAARDSRDDQVIVGFALEPAEELMESARDKLRRKGLAAIVANPLETMDAEDVSAVVILRDGTELAPDGRLAKTEFADWLVEQLPRLLVTT
ncbi:MAG: phosphopantothenoylcysteine decarboxylase domain-containing protein, partial [Planctomycetota bacterium]|jgi:phosphopantothenoylcysteine decarboxylase/phosphopantothenate--cysteine ligase